MFGHFDRLFKRSRSFKKAFMLLVKKFKIGREMLNNAPLESYLKFYQDFFEQKIVFNPQSLKIMAPLLIVYGKFDMFIKIGGGTNFYSSLKPDRIMALWASHFIPSRHPEKLAKIIKDFF
jgi:pimeloyl-ACP methyl ester carboxylesterase